MPLERLHKVIAAAGIASRRASETLITSGRVTVDGRPARIGDQVDPMTARIAIDGHPIGGPAAAVHLALNKPAGVTATVQDRHADRTVLQLLPTALVAEARLYPVGRLDRDSEGLLLLTNDGEWAERVLHPRFGIEREYAVGLPAWLANDQRAALDAGVDLEEGRAVFAHPIRPASGAETARLLASLSPPASDGLAWYRVVLRQGWKRQVRRMFAAVGAPIARLVRVRIGPVRLDDLQSGRYRRLRGTEIKALGVGRLDIAPRREAGAPASSTPGTSRMAGQPASRPATSGRPRNPRPSGPAGLRDASARPGRPRSAAPADPGDRPARPGRPRPGGPRPGGLPIEAEAPGAAERPARPWGTDRTDRTPRTGRPAGLEPTGDAGGPAVRSRSARPGRGVPPADVEGESRGKRPGAAEPGPPPAAARRVPRPRRPRELRAADKPGRRSGPTSRGGSARQPGGADPPGAPQQPDGKVKPGRTGPPAGTSEAPVVDGPDRADQPAEPGRPRRPR